MPSVSRGKCAVKRQVCRQRQEASVPSVSRGKCAVKRQVCRQRQEASVPGRCASEPGKCARQETSVTSGQVCRQCQGKCARQVCQCARQVCQARDQCDQCASVPPGSRGKCALSVRRQVCHQTNPTKEFYTVTVFTAIQNVTTKSSCWDETSRVEAKSS